MRFFLLTFFIYLTTFLNALAQDSVTIEVNPPRPIQGEEFTVEFTLREPHGENSNISFNPIGIDVIDRNVTGRSTRTTYINGKLTVDSMVKVAYTMIASGVGSSFLNDIRVETNGTVTKLPSKQIRVLREPQRPKDVFALAIPSKTDVYAGESIVVRYYIYHNLPLQEFKIDKYAKLDKFLKRFHQEPMSIERVNHEGSLYTRRLVYTAQLFPNKAGSYKLDPMEFTVRYSTGRSLDPFNTIFSGVRTKKKTIRSEVIDVNVRSLPTENVPADFTGLVGKHDFTLEMNKSKFLTNEPIELKFIAKGTGALELYETPQILQDPNLEEFVSDSELNLQADFSATKVFNMTYLGRSELTIPKKEISFSYFDPESEKFVSETVVFPGLEVIPSRANTIESKASGHDQVASTTDKNDDLQSTAFAKVDFFKPVYYFENTYLWFAKYLNLALFVFLLLFVGYKAYAYMAFKAMQKNYGNIELLKQGVDYKSLYNVVQMLGDGSDMKDIIQKSKLTPGTKRYLQDLVDECEKEYLAKGKVKRKKIKLKYLKEIIKVVS